MAAYIFSFSEDFTDVALLNLPLVFNEKRQLLFVLEEVRTLMPLIHLQENKFDIFLDGVLTVSGIRTTVEALRTLLAVYYIFASNTRRV
ncbi:unnamed protein product [Ixodes pacificus]